MNDTIPEYKTAAQAIVKRLPPSTCNGVRADIERRVEAQLEFYLQPLRARYRAEAFRQAGRILVARAAVDPETLKIVHREMFMWADDEEAKAKGDGT